ncbi:MAG: glyoxalase/bleomycin resistance/extradiol dioxygenase family protein [Hyphomicrobiales bacterium]|nr:MAG: glyoxalase/bleomycin resistance/extradiol dioxygenase family protein [Hyphomicrobiales bacterium]
MADMPMITQGLVPYITPSDAPAAAEFYKQAFGATEVVPQLADDGKRYMHCSMKINGNYLFMSDSFPEYGATYVTPQGFNLHLQVDDADFWWKRATDAGCTVTMPLEKQFWGDLYGQLKDPYGISWAIGSTPKV